MIHQRVVRPADGDTAWFTQTWRMTHRHDVQSRTNGGVAAVQTGAPDLRRQVFGPGKSWC